MEAKPEALLLFCDLSIFCHLADLPLYYFLCFGFPPPLFCFFRILLRALLVLIFYFHLMPTCMSWCLFCHLTVAFFYIDVAIVFPKPVILFASFFFFFMVFYCLQTVSDCAVLLCWAAYKTRVRDSPCLQEFMSNVNKAGSQRWGGAEAERSQVPGGRLCCRAVPGPGW